MADVDPYRGRLFKGGKPRQGYSETARFQGKGRDGVGRRLLRRAAGTAVGFGGASFFQGSQPRQGLFEKFPFRLRQPSGSRPLLLVQLHIPVLIGDEGLDGGLRLCPAAFQGLRNGSGRVRGDPGRFSDGWTRGTRFIDRRNGADIHDGLNVGCGRGRESFSVDRESFDRDRGGFGEGGLFRLVRPDIPDDQGSG